MPKAVKLPSGSWRCQVKKDGVRKSFVVQDPTPKGRRECERLAAVWATEHAARGRMTTVGDAMDNYIALREKSLSVTTLTGYKSMRENAYADIQDKDVADITPKDLQKWVDDYKKEHSPKSVSNAAGLLLSSITEETGVHYHVRLPARIKEEMYTPTDADVKALMDAADPAVKKAIMLAAFATLRAGEVCALTAADINGNTITVNKSIARDGRKYVVKAPKTPGSVRTVEVPRKIAKMLLAGTYAPTDRIVGLVPHVLALRFRRLIVKAGLPHFRFHDLRAYSASIRHALGIPDQYIMRDGGWKTDNVMKAIYRRTMEDKRKKFAEIANDHFEKLV